MPDLFLRGQAQQGEAVLKNERTENHNQQPVEKHPHLHKAATKKHHTPTPFTAYCPYPERLIFKDQEEDEEILLLIRHHFITNLGWIFEVIFFSLLPPLVLPFLSSLFPDLAISDFSKNIFILFYYLICFGFVLINFSVWYFNLALITNKRIIDIDITGILFKNVAETRLALVQDVSYTQSGAIRSFFNYGDILVQTAGTLPNFEFNKAPHPAKIIKTIGEIIGKKS